jgi:hypothetical protein
MGRLADLRAKCSGGVSETCSESEFAEFQTLSQENSAGSWFDRIMGGVNSVSGIVFGAYDRGTGQYHPPGGGYYPPQQQPEKKTSPLVWIGVVLGALVLLVLLVIVLRKKPTGK